MLEYLKLENVGPATNMEIEFAPRVNLLTGDNGLGKSFLLDVAWWALTGHWPWEINRRMTCGFPARPRDREESATIDMRFRSKNQSVKGRSEYKRSDEAWDRVANRSSIPSIVLYAHADGSFSVWDPTRNHRREWGHVVIQGRGYAHAFTEAEVWDGLRNHVDGRSIPVCNGLLYDWSAWIGARDDDNAKIMASVLRALSPGSNWGEVIEPGPLMRLSINDSRNIPSISTNYAGSVPILHASSGIRRACALAYMLVWTWSEHRIAADLLGKEVLQRMTMLFDEVESHLHPRWQRSILTPLMKIGNELLDGIDLQLVVTTHSPLVLASAETWFDPEQDAWFDLDLEGDPPQAHLHRRAYTPRGTAGAWLTSEAFDLATDRGSVEAERAILRARELLRQSEPPLDEVMQTHEALRAVLPDVDRFWVRWNAFVERRGGTP